MTKVAFLGPRGTYTHQATLQQFDEHVDIYPQNSIGDCFRSVNSGSTDFAVVPFENSTNGQVVFTYDLIRDWYFAEAAAEPPNFKVVGEQFVSIHHNLLSKEIDLTKITKIYSHPQVWGQVGNFLRTLNPQVVKIDCSSTSKAAEIVSLSPEDGVACISSSMCSRLYNLPIIRSQIEDNVGNTTRFLVLGREFLKAKHPNVQDMSLILFTLNQEGDPGALCSALACFQQHGVNLISINSRPSGKANWQYAFFVEMIGNYLTDDNVIASLQSLEATCSEIVALGVIQRHK